MGVSRWHADAERRVLNDVSLEVRAGQLVGIYGARASGKTTLLQVAAGVLAPTEGRATYGGRDVMDFGDAVGWVSQEIPTLGDIPTDFYVGLPRFAELGHRRARREATGVLAKVGALEYAGVCWSELPNSVRPLVAIAHALIQEPRVLAVDDVTCGLSAIECTQVVSILRLLAEDEGVAVLLASSDASALSSAHCLWVLSNGSLIDVGTVQRLGHGA